MPTLSNGHIGVTVYSDELYINGVYNGEGGKIFFNPCLKLYDH